MHYYQFNIGDYMSDADHLTLLEHGVYRRIMDVYYTTEYPLPTETQSVSRRIRAISSEENRAVIEVLKEFFFLTEKGWEHRRINHEIIEYKAKCETNKLNGKQGGRPKKTKSVSGNNPVGTQSVATINHKPVTNNQKIKPLASSDKSLSAVVKKVNGSNLTPVVEKIPVVGGVEFEVHADEVAEWERLFPAVDVPQTLREIRAWNLANPIRQKTPKGVIRHITQWLAKEQNKPEPQPYRR